MSTFSSKNAVTSFYSKSENNCMANLVNMFLKGNMKMKSVLKEVTVNHQSEGISQRAKYLFTTSTFKDECLTFKRPQNK